MLFEDFRHNVLRLPGTRMTRGAQILTIGSDDGLADLHQEGLDSLGVPYTRTAQGVTILSVLSQLSLDLAIEKGGQAAARAEEGKSHDKLHVARLKLTLYNLSHRRLIPPEPLTPRRPTNCGAQPDKQVASPECQMRTPLARLSRLGSIFAPVRFALMKVSRYGI